MSKKKAKQQTSIKDGLILSVLLVLTAGLIRYLGWPEYSFDFKSPEPFWIIYVAMIAFKYGYKNPIGIEDKND